MIYKSNNILPCFKGRGSFARLLLVQFASIEQTQWAMNTPKCDCELEINHHTGDYFPYSGIFNVLQNLVYVRRSFGLLSLSEKTSRFMVVRAEIRFAANTIVMSLSRDIYSHRPKMISQ